MSIDVSKMTMVEALKLRVDLDKHLNSLRAETESLWGKVFPNSRLGGSSNGGSSRLKGTKVAPKYKGPGGETWAGRGAKPRWLAAAIKKGKKLDSFLIKR
jgi:DNA-binding protein H-NS